MKSQVQFFEDHDTIVNKTCIDFFFHELRKLITESSFILKILHRMSGLYSRLSPLDSTNLMTSNHFELHVNVINRTRYSYHLQIAIAS